MLTNKEKDELRERKACSDFAIKVRNRMQAIIDRDGGQAAREILNVPLEEMNPAALEFLQQWAGVGMHYGALILEEYRKWDKDVGEAWRADS